MVKLKKIEKTDIFFAALLTIWFIYIFYPFHYKEWIISADGVTYAHIAKNVLLDGSLGWQATWAPPFYSILTAGVYHMVKDLLISSYIVSMAMSWLLPVSVYILAASIFNRKAAILAGILTALHPHFLTGYMSCEPEITYTTLLVFSVAFSWLAYSKSSILYGLLSGLLFSMAYMTRSEGFMIFGFVLSAIIFLHIKDKKDIRSLACIAAMVLVFLLASFPYLMFLKETYGKWTLSSKSSYVQIWMKWRIYHDNDLGEQGNPELWGLSKNGKLMWQEPKGVGDLIDYLMSHPEKSIKVYLHNFSMQLPGRIPNSGGSLSFPTVLPIYFAIPALFAFLLPEVRRNYKGLLVVSSPFLFLFVLPIFAEGWVKYLLPYLPFLIVLASVGLIGFVQKVVSPELIRNTLIGIFAVTVVFYDIRVIAVNPEAGVKVFKVLFAEEQIKAGKWAQKRFKGTPNYMIQWSKLAYYLNGRWTAMPVTDYDRMVWYARKNRVDYLVFETSGRGESEEIVKDVAMNTPELEVADVYEASTMPYGVVFFRLKK